MESIEILLGTTRTEQNFTVCAWNYLTKNVEHVYKGGGLATPKTLCLLQNDYIITAEAEKPLLHIWPVNSQEQVKNMYFTLPDKVTSLCLHPSNEYLVAAIGAKLYLWHFNSGRLLNMIQKNFQPITCVVFSSDGSYIAAGGEDGMLVVYKLEEVVCPPNGFTSQKNLGECKPLYTHMDHTSLITDICMGSFGSKSKLATVSYDSTCRLYMLKTGEPLVVFVLMRLSCCVFSATSSCIYVGEETGSINRIHLKEPPRSLQQNVDVKLEDKFLGHTEKVTCLTLSASNDILASGGEDGNIIIRRTQSGDILNMITRGGAITNLKFVTNHRNFSEEILKTKFVLHPLQKTVDTNVDNFVVYASPEGHVFEDEVEKGEDGGEGVSGEILQDMQRQVNELKVINKQLYDAFIKMVKKYNSHD